MTSQQTKTGNNYLMPIILIVISVYVITDTLLKDNDKNLDDKNQEQNLALVQQETTQVDSDKNIVVDELALEEKAVTHESLTTQPASLAKPIASDEPAQATNTTALETNDSPETNNIDLSDDSSATIINEADDTTEEIEAGVTSSTPALAENVAVELFEINTTATKDGATEDLKERTTVQETAPQEVAAQEVAPQVEKVAQELDSQKTDPAIPADEDQAESMPADTAPVAPATTEATVTETKTDTAVEALVDTAIQEPAQVSIKQTESTQITTPEFASGSSLEQSILKHLSHEQSTKLPNESITSNEPVINDTAINSTDENPDANAAINKPTFITPDENKLIFISPADGKPSFTNSTAPQNHNGPNYTYPSQHQLKPNYAATQNQPQSQSHNQYQQYQYEQQQRQQYYAAMQQRQQAQLRAQQQAYQEAYQNEMRARQQRYLAEMKAKQEQRRKAPTTDKKNIFQKQHTQLNAEKRIQQIKQKISQLNEELRQLKDNSGALQKSDSATTPNTAPVSKQM